MPGEVKEDERERAYLFFPAVSLFASGREQDNQSAGIVTQPGTQLIAIRLFASHPIVRMHCSRLLSSQKDFQMVEGEGPPAVGVFDSELRSLDNTLSVARMRYPSMRPILLTHPCDENGCLAWILRGVFGVVFYDRYEEVLCDAVRTVAKGQLWFAPNVVVQWLQMDEKRRESMSRLGLTSREREVLELLLRRLSNKEISTILRISESTTKFHVSRILRKLNVNSRDELQGIS